MDTKLRQLLEDLTRSLYDAIADSPDVNAKLDRIREEGYTLNLLLDCKREDEDDEDEVLETDTPSSDAAADATDGVESKGPPPSFRIDGSDLAFLRSVGIDPTRKMRPSRGRRKSDGEFPASPDTADH